MVLCNDEGAWKAPFFIFGGNMQITKKFEIVPVAGSNPTIVHQLNPH